MDEEKLNDLGLELMYESFKAGVKFKRSDMNHTHLKEAFLEFMESEETKKNLNAIIINEKTTNDALIESVKYGFEAGYDYAAKTASVKCKYCGQDFGHGMTALLHKCESNPRPYGEL